MTETKLTKTGMILSLLPILSIVGIAIFTPAFQVSSGIIFGIAALFSFFPLSLLYVVYVVARFIRFSKDDPAYQGVRLFSLIVGGRIFFSLISSNVLGVLEAWFGFNSLLENIYILLIVLPCLIAPIACPIAEVVLYWKMKPYRVPKEEEFR